jgi:hypothetical protein
MPMMPPPIMATSRELLAMVEVCAISHPFAKQAEGNASVTPAIHPRRQAALHPGVAETAVLGEFRGDGGGNS